MADSTASYGYWSLALFNAVVYSGLVLFFFRPRTLRDCGAFALFSVFLVAAFSEMYGFPLTFYLLSDWLQSRYPQIDWLSHDTGHFLDLLIGWKGNPHTGPMYLLGFAFVASGFVLMLSARQALNAAQQRHLPATTGAYAYVRHPQYLGFILVMLGFLLQWSTLLILVLLLVLTATYVWFARAEEREALAEFGERYRSYMKRVPAFVPR